MVVDVIGHQYGVWDQVEGGPTPGHQPLQPLLFSPGLLPDHLRRSQLPAHGDTLDELSRTCHGGTQSQTDLQLAAAAADRPTTSTSYRPPPRASGRDKTGRTTHVTVLLVKMTTVTVTSSHTFCRLGHLT